MGLTSMRNLHIRIILLNYFSKLRMKIILNKRNGIGTVIAYSKPISVLFLFIFYYFE